MSKKQKFIHIERFKKFLIADLEGRTQEDQVNVIFSMANVVEELIQTLPNNQKVDRKLIRVK